MSSFVPQNQEPLMKRMWQERRGAVPNVNPKTLRPTLSGGFDDDLVSAVVPPVTVVLEGRSICQRISLHKHGNYQSLARALRQMFADIISDHDHHSSSSSSSSSCHDDHDRRDGGVLDLSNAVPGHLIAYEDMENDLLLVGDLNWKDFVRVAKRIRILPVKAKSRKLQKQELN
ncbi:Auxin-responsive protein IAA33 [Sesamum alatum]|uniref:Auxin-responsive protein n=1 Tax=Sesamum alatum TaxID=300844 RepID=A0AAE1XNV7_9LAMI|nr:Auxin-responsive protein IAA33 [Sesamum alatum]